MPEQGMAIWLRDVVGIPGGLIKSLKTDDDWTFVIKMHGLLEATLNQLLINELGGAMVKFITRLETANERTGKLALIRACDLLPQDARQFIRAFSVLRNKCVHDIKNFEISITEYAASLHGEEGRDWRNGLKSGFVKDARLLQGRPIDDYIKEDPKTAIKVAWYVITVAVFRHHKKRGQSGAGQSTPTK